MSRQKRSLPLAPGTRYTPAVLEGIADGERAALALSLGKRTEAGAVAAAASALARAEALEEAAVAAEPPARPIACRAGCSTCCVSKVLVLAPEVLRIAAHLRATRTEAELAALAERVRAADTATRGLSRLERAEAGVPCPLLDERGACSVHAVRPVVCAGWTSLDAAACERHFAAPAAVPTAPMHRPGYEVANAVLAGLGWAAREQGLDAAPLELIAALRIALDRPNAGERWLARLPVFAAARDAEWQEDRRREA
ncbi:YkgJ family cysteine cluster protein [Sorangium sp. So ce1014]|uniref:YkgJ family cysteine cluster protein n=1 Tax=Sorangium sp. So ce1014 TaxID=3133326 RepID=UPI003F62E161